MPRSPTERNQCAKNIDKFRKNDNLFMQFLVIGSVGGSRDNYCITKKDLESTSVFICFRFHEFAVYGIIPFDCLILS